jgi:hypothetical protein
MEQGYKDLKVYKLAYKLAAAASCLHYIKT